MVFANVHTAKVVEAGPAQTRRAKKCPQVEGHVVCLSARHAKLRREGYRKGGTEGRVRLVRGIQSAGGI